MASPVDGRATPPPTADTLQRIGFRQVPRTGVIYVMGEAALKGYRADSPQWANLGQGAPEVGDIPGAPPRLQSIPSTGMYEYAPVDGLPELRDAVAALYNERYRRGMASQYTRDNVSICAGGRLALTRLVSTLGRVNVGHFLPDYTAYEELLGSFGTFVPIPVLLDPNRLYAFSASQLDEEVAGRGLSAVVLSNPCNPTGKLLQGVTLDGWVEVARRHACTLVFDEFYSHYCYGTGEAVNSAASHVRDVNVDPVVLIDGLTKNWRYPGWRVAWTVGPKCVMEALASAGSFLDGGSPHPVQRAAVDLLRRPVADAEAAAIQRCFRAKRTRMMEALEALGVVVDFAPQGGFYCWGSLSRLPRAIATGSLFFRAALEFQVIVVPGEFFDINPGRRRGRVSRFAPFARFSFGPPMDVLERGLASLGRMVASHGGGIAALAPPPPLGDGRGEGGSPQGGTPHRLPSPTASVASGM